jgi:uncharacterized protein YkwD
LLTFLSKLNQVALNQSREQARLGRMTHDAEGVSSLGQRFNHVGFSWSKIAENVAFGQTNEWQVTVDWLNSPGICHKHTLASNVDSIIS